jgi:hypothetical protein
MDEFDKQSVGCIAIFSLYHSSINSKAEACFNSTEMGATAIIQRASRYT